MHSDAYIETALIADACDWQAHGVPHSLSYLANANAPMHLWGHARKKHRKFSVEIVHIHPDREGRISGVISTK